MQHWYSSAMDECSCFERRDEEGVRCTGVGTVGVGGGIGEAEELDVDDEEEEVVDKDGNEQDDEKEECRKNLEVEGAEEDEEDEKEDEGGGALTGAGGEGGGGDVLPDSIRDKDTTLAFPS